MGTKDHAVSNERQEQILASVKAWVSREKGWRPEQYRIEIQGLRDLGKIQVVHVIFLEDSKQMRKGGGESVELFLDTATLQPTAVYHFQ